MTYNDKYIARYNDPNYAPRLSQMSHLRLGFILGTLGRIPKSLLDVGYGNGDFLKACACAMPKLYGFDISDYEPPSEAIRCDSITNMHYDHVTFFDSLEHMLNPGIVSKIDCNNITVSVPWCHANSHGDEWFRLWKHRKYGEHLWHFDRNSLEAFFKESGFSMIAVSNLEDIIRGKNHDGQPNILTAMFRRS